PSVRFLRTHRGYNRVGLIQWFVDLQGGEICQAHLLARPPCHLTTTAPRSVPGEDEPKLLRDSSSRRYVNSGTAPGNVQDIASNSLGTTRDLDPGWEAHMLPDGPPLLDECVGIARDGAEKRHTNLERMLVRHRASQRGDISWLTSRHEAGSWWLFSI